MSHPELKHNTDDLSDDETPQFFPISVLFKFIKSFDVNELELSDVTSWYQLKTLLKQFYGQTKHLVQTHEELETIRQAPHENITDFFKRLEKIKNECIQSEILNCTHPDELPGLKKSIQRTALRRFIIHSKPEISQMLRARNIGDLNEAYSIALQEEKIINYTKSKSNNFYRNSYPNPNSKSSNSNNYSRNNSNQYYKNPNSNKYYQTPKSSNSNNYSRNNSNQYYKNPNSNKYYQTPKSSNSNNYSRNNSNQYYKNPNSNKYYQTPKSSNSNNYSRNNSNQYYKNPNSNNYQRNNSNNFSDPSNSNQTRPPNYSFNSNAQSLKICNYCKKPGHVISDCRKRQFNNSKINHLNGETLGLKNVQDSDETILETFN
ncbi:hypothetical protein WA026_009339 [Henosepilachna vigintioctopunctata]|uniref:CCHC-type domain-containing protein n=1 Tax=Henosepilachna vigintioctopunctata TaxID=420089 RepID=A0AAW1URF5_9CUCU